MKMLGTFVLFLESGIRERGWRGLGIGIALILPYLVLLFAYFPLGFQLSLVNFTYGDGGLNPEARSQLPFFWFLCIIGTYFFEVTFRGLLLRALIRRFSWQKAFWIHWLILVGFMLVFYLRMGSRWDGIATYRFLLGEGLMLAFFAFFFLKTGSLIATALFHGTYNFVQLIVINDILSPFVTFYYYSSASDLFYGLILGMILLASAVLLFMIKNWGMRELREVS